MSKIYQLNRSQVIKTTLDKAWDFIRSPANLNKITPPNMVFKILSDVPKSMYNGLIIRYRIKIPLIGEQNWVSEIKHIKDRESFVDEQKVGPYLFWHHYHEIKEKESGILFSDQITYALPYGFIGDLTHHFYVKNQLDYIFNYRRDVTPKLFEPN